MKDAPAAMVAAAILERGDNIPVAWPHDALVRDRESAESIMHIYKRLGVAMLPQRSMDEHGNAGVEASVAELLHRMQTRRFKVFPTCVPFLEEFRLYHRKNGLIIKERDDVISAVRYALMCLRFAQTLDGRRAGTKRNASRGQAPIARGVDPCPFRGMYGDDRDDAADDWHWAKRGGHKTY